jgi:hypothetical protein
MDTAHGRRGQTGRAAVIRKGEGPSLILSERIFSGLSGMGVDSSAIRSPRSFAAPSSLRALIGPKPRVIADDVWAKLLWAGINLTEADFASAPHVNEYYYPLTMIKALAVVWLFAGLRIDEIRRLVWGAFVRNQPPSLEPRGASACSTCQSTRPAPRFEARRCSCWRGSRNWELVRPLQPPPSIGKTENRLTSYLPTGDPRSRVAT